MSIIGPRFEVEWRSMSSCRPQPPETSSGLRRTGAAVVAILCGCGRMSSGQAYTSQCVGQRLLEREATHPIAHPRAYFWYLK